MSLVVQPYHPGLRDALFAFYARCFPGRDAEAFEPVWRWQYFDNPLEPDGADRIWVVTWENEVVAHLGTMAARVKLNGEVVRGRWSSNLMVDEKYRNGGLGVWLIREWIKACEMTLAKGLSPEVMQVYRRLGWQRVPLRPMAQLPLTLRAATGRITRNRVVNATAAEGTRWAAQAWAAMRHPGTGGFEYGTVESFPEDTDALVERAAERTGLAVLRDRRFLQWRYVDCPVRRHFIETARRDGRLEGLAVLSVGPERGFRRGIIHDLEMASEDAAAPGRFISHCLRRMHAHRADEVAFLPRGEAEQRIVRSLGFVSRHRPDMMMCDVRFPDRDLAGLATDCNVQLGDGDDW